MELSLISLTSIIIYTLAKLWLYSIGTFVATSFALNFLFTQVWSIGQKDKQLKQKGGNSRLGYASTDIHQRWTRPPKRAEWFSFNDVFYRYSLTTLVIIWCQLTQPIKFIQYSSRYFPLHYGPLKGSLIFICFPIIPFF